MLGIWNCNLQALQTLILVSLDRYEFKMRCKITAMVTLCKASVNEGFKVLGPLLIEIFWLHCNSFKYFEIFQGI